MGLFSKCLSRVVGDTDEALRWEVRVITLFCAAISVLDIVTDVVVIYGWLSRDEPEVLVSSIAIFFISVSGICSVIAYSMTYNLFDKET